MSSGIFKCERKESGASSPKAFMPEGRAPRAATLMEDDTERAQVSVLVVDDSADIRETLRLALECEGYRVLEAMDGQSALDLLRWSSQQLVVLLDHHMPGINGMEMLDVIARDDALAGRHAYVMLTGDSPSGTLRLVSGREERAIPVVAKPFDLDDLLTAISRARDSLLAVPYLPTKEL